MDKVKFHSVKNNGFYKKIRPAENRTDRVKISVFQLRQ